jgi:hypothetical protein
MLLKPAPSAADPDTQLVRSDTCFFNVMLPNYSSAAVMRARLLFCISIDSGMDGDEVCADA